MPLVTVTFLGICTHFLKTMHEELPPLQRVVLVNASNAVEIDGHLITPHVATVKFDHDPWIAVDGCHFELVAEPETGFVHTSEYSEVPNLTAMVVHDLEPMPPIDGDAVLNGNANKAALYFDFNSGTVTAAVTEGAVHVTLRVGTENVKLRATPFPGKALPAGIQPEFTFTTDTHIVVMNEDVTNPPPPPPPHTSYAESRYDFLLHYLTAERIPPNPPIPGPEDVAKLPEHPWTWLGAVGSGCSNSNYP